MFTFKKQLDIQCKNTIGPLINPNWFLDTSALLAILPNSIDSQSFIVCDNSLMHCSWGIAVYHPSFVQGYNGAFSPLRRQFFQTCHLSHQVPNYINSSLTQVFPNFNWDVIWTSCFVAIHFSHSLLYFQTIYVVSLPFRWHSFSAWYPQIFFL